MIRPFGRLLGPLSLLSALGALALAAPLAHAGVLSLGACDNSSLSQPFAPWADFEQYKLAPGGDFEGSLAGWSLQGGAQQVGGSETFAVAGPGASSLSLPAGATAVSPPTCVNAAYPAFRFFARSDTPGVVVLISARYSTVLGTITIPVGGVTPGTGWQPTLPLLTGSAVPGAVSGGTAEIELQFTAVGGGAQIDDVFVDPFRSH